MSYKNKIAFALVSGLVLGACSNSEERQKTVSLVPISVTVATPDRSSENSVSASGQIEAGETANISTRMMGFITKIHVSVGDYVKKGELLVSISNDDVQAKKAQAEAMLSQAGAALVNAEKDFERYSALHKQQSASDKELENITFQYNATKAQVEAARQMKNEANAMLAYTNLTAPYSGVITQKMMDAGSLTSPGMSILSMEQNENFHVSATVSENDIDKIVKGAAVTVLIKSTGKNLSGKISEVSRSSQFTGGQYRIKIAIAEKDKQELFAGMYASVIIPVTASQKDVAQEGSPLVPLTSILNRDQLTGLYTVSQSQTAVLRWVRLGKTIGNKVEVLSGLRSDEKYIVNAEGKLYNGVPVKEASK